MTATPNAKLIKFARAILFLCILAVYLYSLTRHQVNDFDERIYITLSQEMNWDFSNYSTANTWVPEELPQTIYKSPVFYHPPLYPFLLKIGTAILGDAVLAGKVTNFLFWLVSIIVIYRIGYHLVGHLGANIAMLFWGLCPIHLIEASMLHMDYPQTVFYLTATALLLEWRKRPQKYWLLLAGFSVALAMLSKYTGPIFLTLPLATLCIFTKPLLKHKKDLPYLFIPACLGFSWWIYVLIRFKSLMPPEFQNAKNLDTTKLTPYLTAISQREWYDLWIYFAAIFPFVIFLLFWLAIKSFKAPPIIKYFTKLPIGSRFILPHFVAILTAVACFSFLNAKSNGYWTFRHIMPVFPYIYILTAVIFTQLWQRSQTYLLKSILGLFLLVSIFCLADSTFYSIQNPQNIRPIPYPLIYLGLENLFH